MSFVVYYRFPWFVSYLCIAYRLLLLIYFVSFLLVGALLLRVGAVSGCLFAVCCFYHCLCVGNRWLFAAFASPPAVIVIVIVIVIDNNNDNVTMTTLQ